MNPMQPETEFLVERASRGDDRWRQALLIRHHDRLIRMVSVRLDRRLAPRVDPADIVQEALLEASQNLSEYLRDRPLPFHAWLRQYVWQTAQQVASPSPGGLKHGPPSPPAPE